jgi:hypothetical protein|tara:strand:+ start:1865 stop:2194 length:330 start_codon:yes stop_codon:yes gene_type:complete
VKKRLTLTNHLGNIVKEIISNKNLRQNDESGMNETEDRIFKFLEEIRSDGEINMLDSTPLIIEEFRQELLTDVICEMDDTEDFLSSTINRKVRNKAKSHLIEWIKTKIS